MVKNITIQAGDVILSAELNETDTAHAVWDALPIHANGNTWGHEIYFQIQVESNLENGQEIVELGDLAYWPPGSAFCLFFGLTPASQGDEGPKRRARFRTLNNTKKKFPLCGPLFKLFYL